MLGQCLRYLGVLWGLLGATLGLANKNLKNTYLAVVVSSVDFRFFVLQQIEILYKKRFVVFGRSTTKTSSIYKIRGYKGREQILALVFDYWTSIFDELTPPKMAGERFRKTELITNRINNEPN